MVDMTLIVAEALSPNRPKSIHGSIYLYFPTIIAMTHLNVPIDMVNFANLILLAKELIVTRFDCFVLIPIPVTRACCVPILFLTCYTLFGHKELKLIIDNPGFLNIKRHSEKAAPLSIPVLYCTHSKNM